MQNDNLYRWSLENNIPTLSIDVTESVCRDLALVFHVRGEDIPEDITSCVIKFRYHEEK